MGMFSWLTSDSNESIANVYSSRPTRTVYLLQPNGEAPLVEPAYGGYGDFGGVDAYVWIAEHNAQSQGIDIANMEHEERRMLGITLAFDEDIELPFPLKLSFDPNAVYEDVPASEICPHQGFFYDDEDEAEGDDEVFVIPDE